MTFGGALGGLWVGFELSRAHPGLYLGSSWADPGLFCLDWIVKGNA